MVKCVYKNCSNNKKYYKCKKNESCGSKVTFFTFPVDIERCKKWVYLCSEKFQNKNIPLKTLFKNKTYKICENHFNQSDYLHNYDGIGRKFLNDQAVPLSSNECVVASTSTVMDEGIPSGSSCWTPETNIMMPVICKTPSENGSRVLLKRTVNHYPVCPVVSSKGFSNSPRIKRSLQNLQCNSVDFSPARKRTRNDSPARKRTRNDSPARKRTRNDSPARKRTRNDFNNNTAMNVPAMKETSYLPVVSSSKSCPWIPGRLAHIAASFQLPITDISPIFTDTKEEAVSDKKRRLKFKKRNVFYIKKSRVTKSDIINKLQGHISPLLLNLIELELTKKTKSQCRYSLLLKQYALAMHLQSPLCYRLLQSVFPLPSLQLLRKWIKKLRFVPGFDCALFSLLKTRAKTVEPKGRFCFLLMDEMSLKKNLKYRENLDSVIGFEDYGDGASSVKVASSALVFMARGIVQKWKQPVAFVYTAGGAQSMKLEELMKTCILKIEETGFVVLGVCTDQGANFLSLFRRLKVSPNKPYFEFNGKKRLVVVDPPHLIKSARNALLDNYVQTSAGLAKWEHILKMYRYTKLRSLSIIHKLTDNHLSPPKFGGRMKVKLATQVLSLSVASALETCLTLGLDIASDAVYATADYCRNFNNLFDICNSSTLKCKYEPNRSLRKGTKRYKFLQESNNNFLESLNIIDPETNKPKNSAFKFVMGWKQTINAILMLMDIVEKDNIKTLQTRNLCQDSLENLFGQIRLKATNPTCYQFQLSFGELSFNDLLKTSLRNNSNCEKDEDSLFLDLQNFLVEEGAVINYGLPLVWDDWSPNNDMAEDPLYLNTINYVGGYLIFLLCKEHEVENCHICVFCVSKEHTNLNSLYTLYKTFEYENGHTAKMKICSNSFLRHIDQLEQIFCKVFPTCCNMKSLRFTIKQKIDDIVPPFEFCNFKWHTFIVNHFLRLRIFREIKVKNQFINEKKRTSSRKLNILQNM